MKLIITRHITRLFAWPAAMLAVMCLAGCGWLSDAYDEPAQSDTDNISVNFRLFTGNTESRATDYYGTNADNYIDLSNLKILIFDQEQKLKQVLYDDGVMDATTSLTQISPGMYELRTKLNPALYNTTDKSKFAIVALANWRSATDRMSADWQGLDISANSVGTLTVEQLESALFTVNPYVAENQPESWMPGNNDSWIPMFGSRYTSLAGYTHAIFNEGNPMPIPDVQLVRALSKIEIVNNDTDGGPTIDRITLSWRNQTGRLMQNYDFEGATENVSATTMPANPGYTNLSIPFYHQGGTNTYTIYVPEMNFQSSDDRRAICVHLDMNGTKHTKWIYLAPYGTDGLPILQSTYGADWDAIKRNYVYRYVINSLGFEFLVTVEPWKFGGKVHINLE